MLENISEIHKSSHACEPKSLERNANRFATTADRFIRSERPPGNPWAMFAK
jgi:hypothetical protein